MKGWTAAFGLALALAACGDQEGEQSAGGGSAPEAGPAAANDGAAVETANAADSAGGGAALAGCPFRETSWTGSIEGGRLLVNGQVDLQMAGFRPTLTERPGAPPGTLALDLTLEPEPSAPVSDLARFERRGAPRYDRGEIWCGGERIAEFDMILID